MSTESLQSITCEEHLQTSNLICLEKECEKRGLLCPLCEQTYHKEHVIKPLKYFLTQLIPEHQSTQLAIPLAEIDLAVSSISAELAKTAAKQDREELQKAFHSYNNKLHAKINNELEIENDLRQFLQSTPQLTLSRVNEFITRYQLHEYEAEEEAVVKSGQLTNFEKLLHLILDEVKDKHQDLLELVKSRAETKDILGLFVFSESKQRVTYQFSEDLKHTSIKITDKLTAKQEHNYSSNFALIQPMICGKKKTLSKKTVKIKIDKLNSWVNLGVCLKSKAQSTSYYFNTEDIGHGGYTISNDGYSWHNTDSASNSFYHGWGFVQGDVVTMVYDPKSKSIKYSKENGDKEHELSCEPIPGEQMYFCITLNTHDESVSIVQ